MTQKELTAQALASIEAHERECEQMIYGLYALVLGSVLVPLIIAMG